MPLALQERLKLSLLDRADAFEEQIQRELAHVASSGPGLTHALELFLHYARTLGRQVDQAWTDAPADRFRLAGMQTLTEHLRYRVELFDGRFTRGHLGVPRALTAAVERECAAMGFGDREAVLTIGPPGNFATFIADLRELLFRYLQVPLELPEQLRDLKLVMIALPELEGTRASWQPVVVGHELAHYLQVVKPMAATINLALALDRAALSRTKDDLPGLVATGATRARALDQIAVRWLNEMICDAYAVHRYGAAGVASLIEFLESVGARRVVSGSHPPGQLRATLMMQWLGTGLDPVELDVVQPFQAIAGPVTSPDWAVELARTFLLLAPDISREVGAWAGSDSHRQRGRSDVVEQVARTFAAGVPGAEVVATPGGDQSTRPADVLNACWLALHRGTDKPVNRLALKALDTLEFLDHWRQAGGALDVPVAPGSSAIPGALTENEILTRLRATDFSRLIVTPKLPNSVRGASLDVRLGNKFIVFEKSSAAAFDALDAQQDPRSMQSSVEKAWGDVFFLHPGQLVLAATLEYLVLPGDLTAQVITRSSYGRLGLLSATAVQVHPFFAGCLTLELVNLGEMPMVITPGERVAQLLFQTTTSRPSAPNSENEKYRYPTGPEFSKIRTDEESETLRRIRTAFVSRRTRPRS